MASSNPQEFMIFHPEKVGLLDLISLIIFNRRLAEYSFVECAPGSKAENLKANWITVFVLILQKILQLLDKPLYWLGIGVEFLLNFYALNGSFFGLILRIFTVSVVIPTRGSANFRSIIGFLDERVDLDKTTSSSLISILPPVEPINTSSDIKPLDLYMLAAKAAYENAAYIEDAVTNHWQMHFVGYFDCWNEYLEENGTQAHIFTDRAKNAQLIIVAFRGTELFNARDWSTDVDLSWFSMGNMGRAHLGFMKALGLQDDKDVSKGWPKEYTGDKTLAYYAIREKLYDLLEEHSEAKIVLTGHSLGAALAILFPSILIYHEETTILNSLLRVIPFAQPRVGDEDFGNYVEAQLNPIYKRYSRISYRYDLVPRIPFDTTLTLFKHFGECIYFSNWYNGQVRDEEPNKNYFNPLYIPSMYFNALLDLLRVLFANITKGKDYKEGLASIIFRAFGLILPGAASHSPRDYVNAVRLGKVTIEYKEMD